MTGGVELERPHEADRQFSWALAISLNPAQCDSGRAGDVRRPLPRTAKIVHCWRGTTPAARKRRACLTSRCGRCLQFSGSLRGPILSRSSRQDPVMRSSRLLPLVVAVALAACGDVATLPVSAGIGPQPTLPPPHKTLLPTVHVAHGAGLGRRRQAGGRRRPHGHRLRDRPRPSALAHRAAQRRRPRRRDQRAAEAGGRQGSQGLGDEAADEARRRRHAERRPDHAPARRQGRRQRRVAQRLPRAAALAVRHGAGRQRLLRRQLRRDRALPLCRRRDPHRRRGDDASRRCRPGRSTTTGPRT